MIVAKILIWPGPQVKIFPTSPLASNTIASLPLIMMTSYAEIQTAVQAIKLGASDYISRPFDSQIVYRRVSNTIMLYTKQRKLISMLTQQYREREK